MDPDLKYCRHCGSKIPVVASYCSFCGSNQQGVIQPPQEREMKGHTMRNIGRARLILILFSIALFMGGLFIGSQAPLSLSDAESVIQDFQNMFASNPTAVEIALNNISICLISFIPVIGTLFMAFVSYNTGAVLSAVAIVSHINRLNILLTIFLFPWTWMEILAYSLASTQGTMLLLGLRSGRFMRELRQTLKVTLICIALLLVGAFIEALALNYT